MLSMPIATSGIAGFDISFYPGNAAVRWLWDNSNLYWIGYYLPVAGPGYADKLTWQGKYETLKKMGWGVAPIYGGKQQNSVKLQQRRGKEFHEGLNDGAEACRGAVLGGIPRQTVLYFDLEAGYLTKAWLEYYWGWVVAVLNQKYIAGLYCSFLVAVEVENYIKQRGIQTSPDPVPIIWAFHPTLNYQTFSDPNAIPAPAPIWCGAYNASLWQFAHHAKVYWINEADRRKPKMWLTVDLNSSYVKDPGNMTS